MDWATSLSEEESRLLSANITPIEIHNALLSLKPYKAPGPNGLHAGFFQHFWPSLGNLVTEEVLRIFATQKMPFYLNQTLVVLIPKRIGPELLGHFRPISLCTTVYKVVSKVIMSRIRPFMQQLVSSLQVTFIPGRKGLDNMIITQEILRSMERKKRPCRSNGIEN